MHRYHFHWSDAVWSNKFEATKFCLRKNVAWLFLRFRYGKLEWLKFCIFEWWKLLSFWVKVCSTDRLPRKRKLEFFGRINMLMFVMIQNLYGGPPIDDFRGRFCHFWGDCDFISSSERRQSSYFVGLASVQSGRWQIQYLIATLSTCENAYNVIPA